MRGLKNVLLPLLFVFFMSANAHAVEKDERNVYRDYREIPGITAEEIALVEKLREERAVFTYGMIPSTECFLTEDGSFGGFGARFSRRLEELFGIEFRPVLLEWGALMAGLEAYTVDFTGELPPTSRYLTRYRMTSPISERLVKSYHMRNDDHVRLMAAGRAPRYSFFRGSSTYDQVRSYSNQVFDTFFVDSYEEALFLLRSGLIDAFLDDNTGEVAFVEHSFIIAEDFRPLLYSPTSFATMDSRLDPIVSVVDRYLKSEGARELIEMHRDGRDDYLRHRFSVSLTSEEKVFLKSISGEANVPFVAEHDNYPVSFYNAQEREFQGIAIDTLRQISLIAGISFTPVNFPVDGELELWGATLDRLNRGEASFATGLLRSRRKGWYLWGETPYTSDTHVLISTAEYNDVSLNQVLYATVGLVYDTAGEAAFREWFPGHPNLITFLTKDDAFRALEEGRIDLLMSTENQLLSQTHYLEKPGFKANIAFKSSYEFFFVFNRKADLLCSILDKAQKLIDTEAISGLWTRKVFDYRAKMAMARISWLISGSVALGVGLLLVFVLFLKNREMSRNLEGLVWQRTRELEIQTESAQVASRAKSEFLARMSHEIRTPLNAVMGMTQIGKQSLDRPEKALSCMEEIETASSHLLDIINDVLDMSKIESGHFQILNEPFDPRDLIEGVVSLINPKCNEKGVVFQTRLPLFPGCMIMGDRMRLKQVLINLLGNAVKFTSTGGSVDLEVEILDETEEGLELTFRVTDTGIGMTEEQVSRLFLAFEQGDASIATRFGGTGLGLTISRNLVGLMGGDIFVKSRFNEGSNFEFTLHFLKSQEERAERRKRTEVPDLNGKRILLAEDVEINRVILKELLSDTCVTIDEAEDGARAVEMFQNSPEAYYDLVFMDVQMPVFDGYEATRRIRSLPRPDARSVAIVAMTANAYREDIDKAISSGMNAHLSKPIDLDAVLDLLAEKLLTSVDVNDGDDNNE